MACERRLPGDIIFGISAIMAVILAFFHQYYHEKNVTVRAVISNPGPVRLKTSSRRQPNQGLQK